MDNEGKMTFGDHLKELRRVLFQSILIITAIFFVVTYYRDYVLDILMYPHTVADHLLKSDATAGNMNASELIAYSYEGPLITFLKTSVYGSLFLSLPAVLALFWGFIRKGLYPHERWKVMLFGAFSFSMFTAGILLGFIFFLPYLLYFLSVYSFPEQVKTVYSFSAYLDLLILLTVVVGIVFQIPVIMTFLSNVGWVQWRSFLRYWRHYILVIFILSAILTPTTDVISMMLLAVPMIILYFLGILLAFVVRKKEI